MQYMRYKAALAGIKVIEVSEACTSQTSHKCWEQGQRKSQGLFICPHHRNTEDNADRNAAFNIAKLGLGYMSKLGVVVVVVIVVNLLRRTIARVETRTR